MKFEVEPHPIRDAIHFGIRAASTFFQRPHRLVHPIAGESLAARYARVAKLYEDGLLTSSEAINVLAGKIMERLVIDTDHICLLPERTRNELHELVFYLLMENDILLTLPEFDPRKPLPLAAENDLRDTLIDIEAKLLAQDRILEFLCESLHKLVLGIVNAHVPREAYDLPADFAGFTIPFYQTDPIGFAAKSILTFTEDFLPEDDPALAAVYLKTRMQLFKNVCAVANLTVEQGFEAMHKLKTPADSGLSPPAMIDAYLGGTPLHGLAQHPLPFVIRPEARLEHTHVCAGTGSGKTQLIQFLIAQDLDEVKAGRASVVVIDSQTDLIRNISRLDVFAPGGALDGKLVLIDPEDAEFPTCLSLFTMGRDLDGVPFAERERLLNNALGLYDYLFGALLGMDLTGKQSTLFNYIVRACLAIPNSSLLTLIELCQPGGAQKYGDSIATLDDITRRFFADEFDLKQYDETKRQVVQRLYRVLTNGALARIISNPVSKLNLFAETLAGKVILISTSKSMLSQTGTQILGRFFLAMLAQNAQQRAMLPKERRTRTWVYVDEAADYFDHTAEMLLREARKYGYGFLLAHQGLYQLSGALKNAFSANTSVKFAAGEEDSRELARQMRCDPGFIAHQPKLSFATFIKGQTPAAVSLQVPPDRIEAMPRMSDAAFSIVRDRMRATYAERYRPSTGNAAPTQPAPAQPSLRPGQSTGPAEW